MKFIGKRVAASALALGVAALGATACLRQNVDETDSRQSVKIAYLPITHALPVFETAEAAKLGTGLKVELVKFGSWPELLDALNSDRVDGASVLIELAMKAKERGVGLKAVALGHKDGNVTIVSKAIESAADLKGKRFAIPHRQSSHYILASEALATAGLSVADAEIVELAPPEMPAALASGQIDAYCVAEPFGAKAVTLDVGKPLFKSEELWRDSLCCGLVLTDRFIETRREDAKTFVENYKAAGRNLTKERAQVVAKEYLSADDETLKLSLEWIRYDDLEITREDYDALVAKVKANGLSDEPPTYDDFVEVDF